MVFISLFCVWSPRSLKFFLTHRTDPLHGVYRNPYFFSENAGGRYRPDEHLYKLQKREWDVKRGKQRVRKGEGKKAQLRAKKAAQASAPTTGPKGVKPAKAKDK